MAPGMLPGESVAFASTEQYSDFHAATASGIRPVNSLSSRLIALLTIAGGKEVA